MLLINTRSQTRSSSFFAEALLDRLVKYYALCKQQEFLTVPLNSIIVQIKKSFSINANPKVNFLFCVVLQIVIMLLQRSNGSFLLPHTEQVISLFAFPVIDDFDSCSR